MKDRQVRMALVLSFVAIFAFVVLAKMAYVQVLANERFSSDALQGRLRQVSVTPDRGLIYDAKGETLAISVEKGSVYVTPSTIKGSSRRGDIVSDLAEALRMTEKDVDKVIDNASGDFAWLKRFAEDDEVEAVIDLNYLGVGVSKEYKREYPKGQLAAHVLGFAGIDNEGLAGAEQSFNDRLSGKAGKLVVEYDNNGNSLPQSIRESVPATPGQNIHLTIDSTIQYVVEREIQLAQEKFDPEAISCVVMDVNTGQILAMANTPSFDPNTYGDYEPETWVNAAVSKVFEPGSTFKAISTSMYLEEDVSEPETQYQCPGHITIDGQMLKCWVYPEAHGTISLEEGLAQSCNVTVAKAALGLGKERFYDYLAGFGMMTTTGIELPGEAAPILVKEKDVVPFDLAALSIGQGNAYTPIQLLTGLNAVANGGKVMRPQIISKVTNRKGNVIEEREPELLRLAISAETSEDMRRGLEGVVTHGIGKQAAVEGYRVAGKTGTAEIYEDGGYLKGRYVLSFAGFAPADHPQISCAVFVSKPKVPWDSGAVAGPIFSAVMAEVMRYLNVPTSSATSGIPFDPSAHLVTVPELDLPMNAEEARQAFVQAGLDVSFETSGDVLTAYLPVGGSKVAPRTPIRMYALYDGNPTLTVPDLERRTIKEAELVLRSLGFDPVLEGSGLAYRQDPAPKTGAPQGTQVSVWFAGTADRVRIAQAQVDASSQQDSLGGNDLSGDPLKEVSSD